MIEYTRQAGVLISALLDHYEEKDRPEAMISLLRSLREAWAKIEADPNAGLSSPRPYPAAVRPTLAITAVFYDAADIPGRL